MTPEEAKNLIAKRLIPRYLADPARVTVVASYGLLTAEQKQELERLFAAKKFTAAGRMLQKGRVAYATAQANARADAIIADGSIDIDGELDEIT